MSFTEEEIKRAAELKLWVESKIVDLQSEIDKLKEILLVVDSVLRRTSFRTAAEVAPRLIDQTTMVNQAHSLEEIPRESGNVHPLIRHKDGFLLANVYVSASSITIIPADSIRLNLSTPPFKSFFLNRILEGMRTKDMELVSQGRIKAEEVISYHMDEEAGVIRRISIERYKEKGRLNEILSTANWVFTRMLEKKD